MLPGPVTEGQEGPSQVSGDAHKLTNITYVDLETLILLQTTRLQIYSLNDTMILPTCAETRAFMDSGS